MKTQQTVRRLGLVAGAAALAWPQVALAEETERSGMDLLKPEMAEFIPACIAFLVIWFLLAKFAWPTILKMMEDRESKIQGDLDSAAQSRDEAEASAEAAKAKLVEAERQAQEIIAAGKREAEEQRTKIIAEAQASATNIIAKAHDAIASERKKAMIELSGQVVDLSVEIASKIIGDALDETEQHHLAEKYLMEVGNLNDE